jgi:hypothetical protein
VILAASAAAGFIALAIFVGLYFLPTIIAKMREVSSVGSVFVINLFFGWTLIGWVIAMAMAARTPPQKAVAATSSRSTATSPRSTASAYRECPYCKEPMRRDASVCPHCRKESQPWEFDQGYWWIQDASGTWQMLDEETGEWATWERDASGQWHGRDDSGEVQFEGADEPGDESGADDADAQHEPSGQDGDMAELEALRARGVLTDEEFERTKARRIGGPES